MTAENAALLAFAAIVPLVILTLTSFVKISVVLSLVRNALGIPEAPSGLVITGLSLILTFFVMAPVAVEMIQAAAVQPAPAPPGPAQPAPARQPAPAPEDSAPMSSPSSPASPPPSIDDALRALVPVAHHDKLATTQRAVAPMRSFLARHARAEDVGTFRDLAGTLGHATGGDELWVLAPAFVTTELREAFAIAILLFVPFLVIDLVVALGLASLGLATTPPQAVALPLKLVLFVAIDGWRLLVDGLLRGYA
jgi:type III secretion protein R